MKKIDVGQTISIIANVGVLAGLVFLAVELHQNNDQLQAQSRYNYIQGRLSTGFSVMENGDLAEVIVQAMDGEALTAAEDRRVVQYVRTLLAQWEFEYGEYTAGRLTDYDLGVAQKRISFHERMPNAASVWENFRRGAPESFVRWMEDNIVDGD